MQHETAQEVGAKAKGWRTWYSILRRKARMRGQQTLDMPQEAPSWSICPSLADLTLQGFIRCYVDEDFAPIITAGAPPEGAIADAWLSLYSDFCGYVGGIQIKAMIKRMRAIRVLSSRLTRIQTIIDALRIMPAECLIEALSNEGYTIPPFDAENADAYDLALDSVEARMKPDMMKLEMLYREMPEPDEDRATPTRDEFITTLFEISKHEGYKVGDDISTLQYCLYVQRLKKHIDYLTKQAQQGHGTDRTGK